MNIRTSIPEAGNKFYNNGNNGGWSWCVNGNPTNAGCNVLANCVGYACGRFNEIIGSMQYKQLCCNAELFVAKAGEIGLTVVSYPTLGGIMVWAQGSTSTSRDGAGHVAIVERIDSANQIYTSESDWGGRAFFNATRNNNNGRWGLGSSYNFIGCIINPAIGDVHWVEPTPTPTKSIEEVAREVINGDWGNGEDRKERLEAEGYDYNEVQNKVNELLNSNEPTNLSIGTRVRAIGTGNGSSDGDKNTAISGVEGTITNIKVGTQYPYLISDNEGPLGWYKEKDLQVI